MLKVIKEKKINEIILTIILYVSFAATSWYATRGSYALAIYQMPPAYQNSFLASDVVAFIVAGLFPLILYELFTRFVFRFAQARLGGGTNDMRYALKYFIIPANLLAFAVKLVYFAFPIASVMGNVIVDFFFTTLAVALFIVFVGKYYVDKTRWGAMLFQLGGTYLIIYAIMVVFGLIMGVML